VHGGLPFLTHFNTHTHTQPIFRCMVMSDLHLEFPKTLENLPPFEVKADYLALLGDIGYPGQESYKTFLLREAKRFKKVFVVPGNHEYYKTTVQQAKADMKQICSQSSNLVLLDRASVELDGVRVIGVTLWELIVNAKLALDTMNDYALTYVIDKSPDGKSEEKRKLSVADTNRFYNDDVAFLKAEIVAARANKQPFVVFSHHPPHYSGARTLFGKDLPLWCYGHTHHSTNQIVSGTRIMSNQLGYISMGSLQESGYVAECVVELYDDLSTNVQYSDSYADKLAAQRKKEEEEALANAGPPPEAPPVD